MNTIGLLDAAAGTILIILALSLIASAIREALEVRFKARSQLLHRGIGELLGSERLVAAFYSHPQIGALYKGAYDEALHRRELPSYIPSRAFALALLDLVMRGREVVAHVGHGPKVRGEICTSLRRKMHYLQSPNAERLLAAALDSSAGSVAKVQEFVERWFDRAMERVSGWYRRKTRVLLLAIGLALAAATNVDAVRVARGLARDPRDRQAAVAIANAIVADGGGLPSSGAGVVMAKRVLEQLDDARLPVGWPDTGWPRDWFSRLIGWLITACAVSLGAPFWFDALGTVMRMRSTVKPDEKKSVAPSGATGVPSGASPPSAFEPHAWASGREQEGVL